MTSNGAPLGDANTKNSLEKIKKQLASSSGINLLQGPLLKRSETLRKWNERWVILDPTTGKMEYKVRRNKPTVKGTMVFDANSTITISPMNFQYWNAPEKRLFPLCRNSWCCQSLGINFTETLSVKDEELQNLGRDLRARDATLKGIAENPSETAEAAEAAASAAHTMDEQRRIACVEIERLTRVSEKCLESSALKRKRLTDKTKARERVVILEGAVVRAEEKVRVTEGDAEARIKEATEREAPAAKEKQELLACINMLQEQLNRQQVETRQIFEEKTESCLGMDGDLPRTKHVNPMEENVDKACLSVSKALPVPAESEWSDIQTTEATIADVREVSPDKEGSSPDIPVVTFPVTGHQEHSSSHQS